MRSPIALAALVLVALAPAAACWADGYILSAYSGGGSSGDYRTSLSRYGGGGGSGDYRTSLSRYGGGSGYGYARPTVDFPGGMVSTPHRGTAYARRLIPAPVYAPPCGNWNRRPASCSLNTAAWDPSLRSSRGYRWRGWNW